MHPNEDPWSVLLKAANAGDSRSYAQFLRAVTPVVRGIVRARGRSFPADQHEDIVQDILLGLHRKRHTWRQDHPVRPWVYAIARHKIIDAYRRRGLAVHVTIDDFSDVLEAVPDTSALAARDDRREVDRLIDTLDERSAEIIRAVALREESHADVSARFGLTEGTLRVTLHRAMKRLIALGRGGEG